MWLLTFHGEEGKEVRRKMSEMAAEGENVKKRSCRLVNIFWLVFRVYDWDIYSCASDLLAGLFLTGKLFTIADVLTMCVTLEFSGVWLIESPDWSVRWFFLASSSHRGKNWTSHRVTEVNGDIRIWTFWIELYSDLPTSHQMGDLRNFKRQRKHSLLSFQMPWPPGLCNTCWHFGP